MIVCTSYIPTILVILSFSLGYFLKIRNAPTNHRWTENVRPWHRSPNLGITADIWPKVRPILLRRVTWFNIGDIVHHERCGTNEGDVLHHRLRLFYVYRGDRVAVGDFMFTWILKRLNSEFSFICLLLHSNKVHFVNKKYNKSDYLI